MKLINILLENSSSSNFFKLRKFFKDKNIFAFNLSELSQRGEVQTFLEEKLKDLNTAAIENGQQVSIGFVYAILQNDEPFVIGKAQGYLNKNLKGKIDIGRVGLLGDSPNTQVFNHVKAPVTALWSAHHTYTQEENTLHKLVAIITPELNRSLNIGETPVITAERLEKELHSLFPGFSSGEKNYAGEKVSLVKRKNALKYRIKDYAKEFGSSSAKKYFSNQNKFWPEVYSHLMATDSIKQFHHSVDKAAEADKELPGFFEAYKWLFGDTMKFNPKPSSSLPDDLSEKLK